MSGQVTGGALSSQSAFYVGVRTTQGVMALAVMWVVDIVGYSWACYLSVCPLLPWLFYGIVGGKSAVVYIHICLGAVLVIL